MPETPQYTVEYRNVKHPRCEFKTGTLLIVLPKKGWTPEQVLEKYGEWIKRKQDNHKHCYRANQRNSPRQKQNRQRTKKPSHRYAEDAQKDLNTKINKIYFRKMKTKWASHSQNNN
jgi:hypothetical protein